MPGMGIVAVIEIEIGSPWTGDDYRISRLEGGHQQPAGGEARALIGDGQIAGFPDFRIDYASCITTCFPGRRARLNSDGRQGAGGMSIVCQVLSLGAF